MSYSSVTGDLLRAWSLLRPDAEARMKIAQTLGFAPMQAGTPTPQVVMPLTKQAMVDEHDQEASFKPLPETAGPIEAPLDISVTTLATQPSAVQMADLLSGPALEQTTAGLKPPAAKKPLFTPTWARAILSALVATNEESTELDVMRLTNELASGQPIRKLPRRPTHTMRLGVVCWIDEGTGMEPFTSDVSAVVLALRAVAGENRVFVRRFRALPKLENRPPAPLTCPVLIVSDFGLTDQTERQDWATSIEWEALIGAIQEMGTARNSGLLPVASVRWPANLRRAIQLVSWDRASSVRSIAVTALAKAS